MKSPTLTLGALAAAAMLAVGLAGPAHAASPLTGNPPALVGAPGGQPMALTEHVFATDDILSYEALGSAANEVFMVNIGANAHVTGLGWDVNLTATSPSWLSELRVAFGDSSGTSYLFLTPGVGDGFAGTADYSSGGVQDLIGGGFDFYVGADGMLRLEFFEGYDDLSVEPDGMWNSGSLVIQTAAIPEPGTYALMAFGLALIGTVASRRRRAQG